MPTITAGGFTPRINIEPTIYGTQPDLLERAFKVAQLRNLEIQPDVELRRLGLQEQTVAETRRQNDLQNLLERARLGELTSHNVAEETDADTKNQIARDTLKAHLQVAHDANQQRMAEAILTHLPSYIGPGGLNQGEAIKVAAGAVKDNYPALASSLLDLHQQDIEKKVATALATITTLKKTGHTAGIAGIPELTNPDVASDPRIKELLPEGVTPSTAAPGAPDLRSARFRAAFGVLSRVFRPAGLEAFARSTSVQPKPVVTTPPPEAAPDYGPYIAPTPRPTNPALDPDLWNDYMDKLLKK